MLTKQRANVRLRMGDKVYLAPFNSTRTAIVTLPLASYLPGMKVEPAKQVTP